MDNPDLPVGGLISLAQLQLFTRLNPNALERTGVLHLHDATPLPTLLYLFPLSTYFIS